MRNFQKLATTAVFALSFAVAVPLFAQDRDGTGNVGTSKCDGGPREISGEGNQIRVTGYCSVLTVSGTGNVVTVDRAGVIEVEGTGNLVQYIQMNPGRKKNTKVRPAQRISGTGNVVQWNKSAE
jgi:hypothetical protein